MSIIYFFSPQLTISRIDEDTDTELRGGTAHTDLVGWNKLRELLRTFFPSYIMDSSHLGERICLVPEELLDAIRTQLQERHLQLLPSLIEKVRNLFNSLFLYKLINLINRFSNFISVFSSPTVCFCLGQVAVGRPLV